MNHSIFYFFHNFANKSEVFDGMVFFVAEIFPYIVVFLAFLYLLKHHDVLLSQNPFREFAIKWKEIVFVLFSACFAWFLATGLKMFLQTQRPFLALPDVQPLFSPITHAFPSQHTVFFMSIAGSLFLIHKRVGLVFVVFGILIGVSRIVAGVHYPIDILGGVVIGIFISYLLDYFFKKI